MHTTAKSITDHEHSIFNAELGRGRARLWLAYVLWFFFGSLGAHKFYLGRAGVSLLSTDATPYWSRGARARDALGTAGGGLGRYCAGTDSAKPPGRTASGHGLPRRAVPPPPVDFCRPAYGRLPGAVCAPRKRPSANDTGMA